MINRKGGRSQVSPFHFIILVILILGFAPLSVASDDEPVPLGGLVIDFESRQPIDNATVTVWEDHAFVAKGYTNALGLFTVQVPRGHSYRMYAYADDPRTPGWDYLPAIKEVLPPTGGINLTVELRPGASVIIEEDIQFVDTTIATTAFTFEVRDLESGEVLDIDGYTLVYGTVVEAQNFFLNLEATYLVVPAEVPFDIRVNASALVGGKSLTRSFVIDEPGHLTLSKADLIHLDVRKYSLPYNIGLVEERVDEVEVKMDEMDRLGFYIFLEKQRFVSVSGMVDTSRFNLVQGAYKESYKELRRAYIEITDLHSSLTGMRRSAATSVYVLIFFLAFTSTAISFLLFQKPLHNVVASGGLTALMHVVLHEIYPGADYIPTVTFLEFSAIAWCAALFTTVVLPRFMKGRAVGGKTPLRNIIVPIFSLAKRSLTRRLFRFILTLSSVTILVMSFVSLTSFTMGYGLILRPISKQIIPVEGVLIRAPRGEQEAEWSTFTPLDLTAVEWLQKQGEVELIAPKAENLPSLMPLLALDGKPIYGIIGILPSVEAQILGLDELIVEGSYLREGEEDSILISDDLKEELGVEVNATLRIGEMRVRIVGVFEGERLRWLKDIDGIPIIPNKLVDFSAPEGPPDIQDIPVETNELLICSLETALRKPGVFLSRIDATIREGEPVVDFAERTALERNYDAWASSGEGLYVARLGAYFQGKGLPVAVPWGIVVLNVVITMLNSLYERRREIGILSSVGLNPSHLAGIFVAEAFAIGLIGGGMGYLLGLGMYKAMTFLHITLEVRQKVSAFWSLGALLIAMTAVIIGALSALKGSVIITPSLMRRWRIKGKREIGEPIEMTLPVWVPREGIDDFMDYLFKTLKWYEKEPTARTERVRIWREDTEEKTIRGIRFVYRTVGAAFSEFSSNRLIAERKRGEEVYTVKMFSFGDSKWVHQTGSLVRLIIMRWSTQR